MPVDFLSGDICDENWEESSICECGVAIVAMFEHIFMMTLLMCPQHIAILKDKPTEKASVASADILSDFSWQRHNVVYETAWCDYPGLSLIKM